MFDYVLTWTDIATARQDAAALANMLPDGQSVQQWMQDHVIPGLKVWRVSQNPNGIDTDGNYVSGYFALVSVNKRVSELDDDSACVLILDRKKMNAAQSGFVVHSAYSAAILKDVRFEPIFMGMSVPWGGLN